MEGGMGKANWKSVAKLMNQILVDSGISCVVYTNQTKMLVEAVEAQSISSDLKRLQRQDPVIMRMKNEKGFVKGGVLLKLFERMS